MKTSKDGYKEALSELSEKRDDITEEKQISVAVGMALEGKTPFVHACTALGKNWEAVKEAAYKNANIKIADTPKNCEDTALLRALPNITIIIPADYHEAKKATFAAGIIKGPVYIRLAKEKTHATTAKTPFTLGRAEIMRAGKDCTIIANGTSLHDALIAADKLSKQEIECTVLNCHTIQPIDKHAIIASARLTGCMVTAEERIPGGLGSAVAEITSQNATIPLRITKNEGHAGIIKAVKEAVQQRCESVCTEIPEEHGKKLFLELHPELYFRLHGGGTIKSIPGLHKALITMNNETFSHHCNEHKNDFSAWVREVFKEPALAKNLEKTRTRLGMALALTRWIK
jgi:transketolase